MVLVIEIETHVLDNVMATHFIVAMKTPNFRGALPFKGHLSSLFCGHLFLWDTSLQGTNDMMGTLIFRGKLYFMGKLILRGQIILYGTLIFRGHLTTTHLSNGGTHAISVPSMCASAAKLWFSFLAPMARDNPDKKPKHFWWHIAVEPGTKHHDKQRYSALTTPPFINAHYAKLWTQYQLIFHTSLWEKAKT